MGFLNDLADWLASRYGLDMGVFGENAVADVIALRCRRLGLADEIDYPTAWSQRPAEREAFLERLLVGETWFFREWPAFALLQKWLLDRKQSFCPARPLRILTLPCSTGEEAWSIAAIVHEAGIDPDSAGIDAMDISPSALDFARTAIYPLRRLRSQSPERWAGAFIQGAEGTLKVSHQLRSMVRFAQANAMDLNPEKFPGAYDVIFCRNMMIYMKAEARHQVCERLLRCLRQDGLLFMGHAEQPPPESGLVRRNEDCAFAWHKAGQPRSADRPVVPHMLNKAPPVMKPATASSLVSSGVRPELHFPEVVRPSGSQRIDASPPASPAMPAAVTELDAIRRLADQGRYTEAISMLEAAGSRQSLDPEVHCLAGVLLSTVGRKQEGMTRFRHALYLDAGHQETLAHLALLLEEQGESAAAARLRTRLAVERSGPGT